MAVSCRQQEDSDALLGLWLKTIDEHIECCAGEANDAEREAVLIFCAKCHFCRVPRRFKAAPAARSFQMFGFVRLKRRMIKGSVCCD